MVSDTQSKALPTPPRRDRIRNALRDPLSRFPPTRWLQKVFGRLQINGWRAIVVAGTFLAFLALIINIALLCWASSKPKDDLSGDPQLFNGECSRVPTIFTWSTLAINVLSTLLLGSSNATMQCLVSPTRQDVDRAHTMGDWLDVGIPGLRNWKAISRWRKVMCVLLALSSLPLHIFYNSVIYASNAANEYIAVLGGDDFVQGKPSANVTAYSTDASVVQSLRNIQEKALAGQMLRKENRECIDIYQTNPLTDYSNVILVVNGSLSNLSHIITASNGSDSNFTFEYQISQYFPTPKRGEQYYGSDPWPCFKWDGTNSYSSSYNSKTSQNVSCKYSRQGQNDWTITFSIEDAPFAWEKGAKIDEYETRKIEHCLVQPTQRSCSIQMSSDILVVVITFNAVKLFCFFLALMKRDFVPLVTLGDAIASFLERPDEMSNDMGIVSADELRWRTLDRKYNRTDRSPMFSSLNTWRPGSFHCHRLPNGTTGEFAVLDRHFIFDIFRRRRWASGASPRRWVLIYSLWITLWLTGFCLCLDYWFLSGQNISDTLQSGFGAVSSRSILISSENLPAIMKVLLANLLQLVVSLAYMAINGLLTCLIISREFMSFGRKRTGLRVTFPKGYQRSTFWLSLPYRYSIPLLGISTLLHWALSQTLFVATIRPYTPNDKVDDDRIVEAINWSVLASVISLSISLVIMSGCIALGCKRYSPCCPVVESNSLAIAAACHSISNQPSDPTGLIKYGVLGTDAQGRKRVGMSSGPVRPLDPDEEYF